MDDQRKMIADMTLDEEMEFIAGRIPRNFGAEEAKGFFAGARSMLMEIAEEKVLAEEDAITRACLAREAGEHGGPEIIAGLVFRYGLVVLIVEKQ